MSERDYMTIVQSLLAKAQATTFPDEADTYLAKAQELMAKHAIDEAMLADSSRTRAQVGSRSIICEPPYAPAKTILVTVIADANNCRAIRTTKDHAQTMVVFGYDLDLDHVEALYTSLSLQATTTLLNQPDTSRRFRHAFLLAFASRVGERLATARRQAQADLERDNTTPGRSVSLVLADRRDMVDDAFHDAFPSTRTYRPRVSSPTGLAAGDRAGRTADIGNTQLGARSRHLPRG